MITTIQLTAFAFAANVGLGAVLVWAAYSGLERSAGRGVLYTLVFGATMIGGNWFAGDIVRFSSWGQFEAVGLAAAFGAFVGIGVALLVWEPDTSSTIPPIKSEKKELDDAMSKRTPATQERDD